MNLGNPSPIRRRLPCPNIYAVFRLEFPCLLPSLLHIGSTVFEAIIPTLTQWLGSWSQIKPCFCLQPYLWRRVFLGSITPCRTWRHFPTACAIGPGLVKLRLRLGLVSVCFCLFSSITFQTLWTLRFPLFIFGLRDVHLFFSVRRLLYLKSKRHSNLSQQPAHIETISTLPDLAPFWTSSWTARGLILL